MLRSTLAPLLAGILAYLSVAALDLLVTPSDGEPLALRWSRVVAEHPIRCSVGFALLAAALGVKTPFARRGGPISE